MRSAKIRRIISRFSAFGYRLAVGAALALVIVAFVALMLMAGFTNAINGFHNTEIATIEHGLERASMYCALSPATIEELSSEFFAPSHESFMSKLDDLTAGMSSAARNAVNAYIDDNFRFRNTIFGLTNQIGLANQISFPPMETSSIVHFGPSIDPINYEGQRQKIASDRTVEVVDMFESKAWEIYLNRKTVENILIPETSQSELLQKFILEEFYSHVIEDTLTKLSTSGNCEWTFSSITKTDAPDLLWYLVRVMLDEWELPETHLLIDNWRGGFVLTFVNPWFGATDLTMARDGILAKYSIVMPNSSGSEFIQAAVRTAIPAWFLFASAVIALTVWKATKPLRKLDQATVQAESIIRANRSVSKEIEKITKQLSDQISPEQELRKLLLELSSLLDERERWMGQLVHQIKNDLTAMNMGLHNIESDLPNCNSSFRHILSASKRIENMLRSVTAYQLVILGKGDSSSPHIAIDLGSLLETIASEIEDAGGEIQCTVAEKLYVTGQPDAIRSALQNLVWNAYLHGGAIKIFADRDKGEKFAEIFIDDDGPGILNDEIEELYKPYRRGRNHSANTGNAFGSAGLGLFIVRHIIASHKGYEKLINRYDENGKVIGLRAHVKLPIHTIS